MSNTFNTNWFNLIKPPGFLQSFIVLEINNPFWFNTGTKIEKLSWLERTKEGTFLVLTTMKSSLAPKTRTLVEFSIGFGTVSDAFSFLRSNSGIRELSLIRSW